MKELYVKTVEAEAKAILSIANKNILPRGFRYLKEISSVNSN
jgi:glutamine synthetase type III